jgi:uncharacterized membrane protein YbhN (UPF0104 family)
MQKNHWFIIKTGISIILVALPLFSIGLTNVVGALTSIPIEVFFLLFSIALVTILINALAVWVLYREVSSLRFSEFLPTFLSSWVAGFLLPGKVGSLSITLLLRDKVKPGTSAAIFVLDKLITVVLALVIGTFFIVQYVPSDQWIIPIALLLLSTFVGFFFFLSRAGRQIMRQVLGSRSSFFEGFSGAFPIIFHHPKGILVNAGLTLIRTGVQAVSLIYLFSSLGYQKSYFEMLALSSMENLASLIPVTISGIGLREGVLGAVSTQIGIPFSVGTTAGLVMTLVMILVVLPGILAFDEKKVLAPVKGKKTD